MAIRLETFIVNNRSPFSAFRLISLFLLLVSVILTSLQLVRFSRIRANLPSGMRLAGVPVGGLDRAQASQRVLEAYSVPIQLRYGDAVILLPPSTVDFQISIESMLALADVERTQSLFWQDYWDYLWNRETAPPEILLASTYSEARLRLYRKGRQGLSERQHPKFARRARCAVHRQNEPHHRAQSNRGAAAAC